MSPLTKYFGKSPTSLRGFNYNISFETRIQNPFIDKSDIYVHKAKQQLIGNKMNQILEAYK